MRLSILSKLVVALATVVALFGPARPAHAADVGKVIDALQKAYSIYNKLEGNELTLNQATSQILSAIGSAKTAILAQVDAVAAAEARACAKSVIITFENIQNLSWDNKQQLAVKSIDCMTLIESLLEVVESKPAVDKLGYALNALGPITLLAHRHAGLQPSSQIGDMLSNGNWAVIAKLHPPCSQKPLWGDSSGGVVEVIIRCKAYNGDTGVAATFLNTPYYAEDRKRAENQATRNTSRAIAQALLPRVGSLGAPAPVRLPSRGSVYLP